MGLFQLKWHDIYGRSLRERHSRRLNLLKANDWVEAVSAWLEGRTDEEIRRTMQIEVSSTGRAPQLFVVSRYASHFSGDGARDKRATWLGWADLVKVALTKDGNVLEELARLNGLIPKRRRPLSGRPERFVLPNLAVEVVVNNDSVVSQSS
jgi:hypothetical protein